MWWSGSLSGLWSPAGEESLKTWTDAGHLPKGLSGQPHVLWVLIQESWPQRFYLIDLEMTNLLDRCLETTETRGGKPFGQGHTAAQ